VKRRAPAGAKRYSREGVKPAPARAFLVKATRSTSVKRLAMAIEAAS
jgi:hypothetical protein